MAPNELNITVETEPLVKVWCKAHSCIHNLVRRNIGACCNLKYIEIASDGRCEQYQEPSTPGQVQYPKRSE